MFGVQTVDLFAASGGFETRLGYAPGLFWSWTLQPRRPSTPESNDWSLASRTSMYVCMYVTEGAVRYAAVRASATGADRRRGDMQQEAGRHAPLLSSVP